MKKFLAIFLALTVVLGLCACGGGGSSSSGGLTEDGKVKLTVGIGTDAMVTSLDNNALTKWLEETCGVELTFVEYAGGTDVATQISTTIAANQELPNILWGVSIASDTVKKYGQDGYFVDLAPYYADKEGKSKNFWERVESELTEEQQALISQKMADPDTGAIYGAGAVLISPFDKQKYQVYINTKWLDAVGMEKPTNTDELYAVLKAFKDKDPNGNGQPDEIPLLGSQAGTLGGKVIDWIINMFLYYNDARPYNVSEDGKLSEQLYLTDEYREALKFIRKLYAEGLLSPMTWTTSGKEMKQITTPSAGTALCGIFVGHPTSTTAKGAEVLYEYEPLQTWGCVVRNDLDYNATFFITESCQDVDKAFEVFMAMASWEGSMRGRYGEPGVNWTEADPGSLNILGTEAKYKILHDVSGEQHAQRLGKYGPVIIDGDENEGAQNVESGDKWFDYKISLLTEHYQLGLASEEANNPERVCPPLTYTEAEKEERQMIATNVSGLVSETEMDFITGTLDINDDAVWAKYKADVKALGSDRLVELAQAAYDRT